MTEFVKLFVEAVSIAILIPVAMCGLAVALYTMVVL